MEIWSLLAHRMEHSRRALFRREVLYSHEGIQKWNETRDLMMKDQPSQRGL